MSEHTVSDLCRAVLEHDERATKGSWEYDDENYIFQVENHAWKAMVAEIRGEGDKLPYNENAELIAHYRSACPTIARAYLELEEQARKYRAALFRIWSPDYVMKNDALWAYRILRGRCELAGSVLGEDRMKFDQMDERLLAWKDPQGEGEV